MMKKAQTIQKKLQETQEELSKEEVKKYADACGMSLSAYIIEAIKEKSERKNNI